MKNKTTTLIDNKLLEIWRSVNVDKDRHTLKKLSDAEYVVYSAWRQLNNRQLYNKYLPNIRLVDGSENVKDNIIFHGGCKGCLSQQTNDIERCYDCMYFRANWNKPDLTIK